MKTPFTESDRYLYDLTPDSVVIDGGCYEGNFSKILSEKYGCRILAFEPINAMADMAAERLAAFPNVTVHNSGIGGNNRVDHFYLKGNMTGVSSEGCVKEEVRIRDIADIISEISDKVHLLKLNIEAGEYETLERLIASGLADRCINIAVQWHAAISGFRVRRDAITLQLSKTHELTWQDPDFGTGHENHKLKS